MHQKEWFKQQYFGGHPADVGCLEVLKYHILVSHPSTILASF
jgi:hypothetical protein